MRVSCDRSLEPGGGKEGGDKTQLCCLSLRSAQARAQGAAGTRGRWYFPRAKRKFAKRKLLSQKEQWLRADTLTYRETKGHHVSVTAR